jgi:hypothetical protein
MSDVRPDRSWLAASCAAALVACAAACTPAGGRAGSTPAATSTPAPAATTDAELARPLPSPVPDVVARVNGQEIRLVELLPLAKAELRRPSVAEPKQREAEALRRALQHYVERELLVQEALARGVTADQRLVDWSYDQARREHPDDAEWAHFLAGEGMTSQSFKTEVRVRQTVAALVEAEARAHGLSRDAARAALLDRLRAKARIELYL